MLKSQPIGLIFIVVTSTIAWIITREFGVIYGASIGLPLVGLSIAAVLAESWNKARREVGENASK